MNEEWVAVLIAVPVVVGLPLAAYWVEKKRKKKRAEARQAFAALMGWAFTSVGDLSFIAGMRHFFLFSRKQNRGDKILHIMQGQIGGANAAIFDYTYEVGEGQTAHTTVAWFHSPRLNLPLFHLRPENVQHKVLAAFGYQDIDFQSHPEFSAKFLLRGDDEQAVRRVFNANLLNFFERYVPACVEGMGSDLVVYRLEHFVAPEELRQFLNHARDVLNAFESYGSLQNPRGSTLPTRGPF